MLYSLAISVLLLLSIEKTSKLVQATYKLIVMFFENEDFFPLNFDQNYNKVKENTIFINFFGGVLFNYYFASCCTLLFSVCDRVCALIFYSLHKRIGRKVTIVTIILMHISSIFLSSLPMITKAYYLRYELVRNTIVIINGVNCKTFLLGTFLPLLVILLFLICFYLYIVAKHYKTNVANNQDKSSFHKKIKTKELQIIKIILFFVLYFLISTIPICISVFLSYSMQLNKNKVFFIVPTNKFYKLFNISVVS